jgi:hypothetical protein
MFICYLLLRHGIVQNKNNNFHIFKQLATKKKIALRWYGASLQRHILLLRSSIFRDANALVEKLEAEEGTDYEGSDGLGIKRTADGYTRQSEALIGV